jgi:hypothetical protein
LIQLILGIGVRRGGDRVGPAEIVQAGDPTDAATDGDDVTHGLIDGTGYHMIGIDIAISRTDAVGDHDTHM